MAKMPVESLEDCAWMATPRWTGKSHHLHLGSSPEDGVIFSDGVPSSRPASISGWNLDQVTTPGHTFTHPLGVPSVNDLDAMIFNLQGDLTLTSVTSTAGAAWTLITFAATKQYGAYRVATGSESASALIVMAASACSPAPQWPQRVTMHWSRWR